MTERERPPRWLRVLDELYWAGDFITRAILAPWFTWKEFFDER
jgi:hypothetical protein